MSAMYKCDRCGKKFAASDTTKTYDTPSKILIGDIDYDNDLLNRIDLCPKCSAKFFNWWRMKDEEND